MEIEIKKDFIDLIPAYMESLNEDILRIEKFLVLKDFESLQYESHKMKGHGNTYGFEYISNMGSAMEYFAINKKDELIGKSLEQVKNFIKNIKIVFVE